MVLGLICFVLFSFWLDICAGFQLEKVFSLTMGLSLINLTMYLFIIVWGVTLKTRGTLFQQNNVNRYMFIMIFYMAISIILHVLSVQQASLKEEIVNFKNYLNPWILFFLMTTLVNDKKTCERSISALNLFLIVTVFATLVQNYTGFNLGTHLSGASWRDRSAGFADPNEYAAFLVLFLPLFVTHMLLEKERIKRIKGLCLFLIGLIGLILTISKGGFIAFFISMGCFFLYTWKNKIINVGRIYLFIVSLFALASISYILLPSGVKEKLIERVTLQRSGPISPWAVEKSLTEKLTSGRTEIWMYSLELIVKKPILGYGKAIASVYIPRGTHNDYLGWLLNYGIVGFLLLSIIFIQIFRYIMYKLKTSNDQKGKLLYLGYLFGLIGYVTTMFGNCIGPVRIIFWIYTAMIYKYAQFDTIGESESVSPSSFSSPQIGSGDGLLLNSNVNKQ